MLFEKCFCAIEKVEINQKLNSKTFFWIENKHLAQKIVP